MKLSLKHFLWGITGLLTLIMALRLMVEQGMFLDGLWYATIARNMSVGLGTFWDPMLDPFFEPHFRAHPTLAFWLESLLFRMLGEGLWVERLYSGLCGVVQAGLIIGIWRETQGKELAATFADSLPVMLWLMMPVVGWGFSANMLENTLLIWILVGVYASLRWPTWGPFSISVALTLGFLTKGPMVFFLAAWPFLSNWIGKKVPLGKAMLASLQTLAWSGLWAVMLVNWPSAWAFMQAYWQVQILGSLAQEATSFWAHLWIIDDTFSELIPLILLAGGLFVYHNRKKSWVPPTAGQRAWIKAFLALAVLALLPFTLSSKARHFYLLPALPFFSLATAHFLLPVLKKILPQHPPRAWWIGLGVLVLGTSIWVGFRWGAVSRPGDGLTTVQALGPQIPARSAVGYVGNFGGNQSMVAYFYRYYYISLNEKQPTQGFIICAQGEDLPPEMMLVYRLLDTHEGVRLYQEKTATSSETP